MDSKLLISELQKVQSEYFISEIVARSSDQKVVLYVTKDRVSEVAQKGYVSKVQLKNLKKRIEKEFGVTSEIIFTHSEKLEKMSRGFETLLKTTFTDQIEEIVITFLTAHKVNVWAKLHDHNKELEKAISDFLQSILSPAQIEILSVQWLDDSQLLPSLVNILSAVKIIQPATIEEVSEFLNKVNVKWLNRQLDKLIKNELVLRESDSKTYSLTSRGLNVVPNALNRNNTDILRALDLGRRKW